MSALISDVMTGRIDHQVARAVTAAGGKMLKAVELQLRYADLCDDDGLSLLDPPSNQRNQRHTNKHSEKPRRKAA